MIDELKKCPMTLSPAARPAFGSTWQLQEGYRVRAFKDQRTGIQFPMLTAAISAERVFDAFYELLAPLGETVGVVLESSHGSTTDRHRDFRRNQIDAPVLKSHLCDFEELLVNDGCTGVAVMAHRKPIEVQFDEHKTITVYAPELKRFRRVLKKMGIPRLKEMKLVSEMEHMHFSSEQFADSFRQLGMRIGIGEFGRVFSDGN